MAAVLFTDMVDSTAIAEELGDRRWKALVHEHHRIVRRAIKRLGGTEHDTAGDGFFASFREPASAIACACEATESVRDLGVELRAGVHFGECEHIGKKLGGITVVVGARIMSLGSAGDVLVSSTAAELSRGAGFGFADRGMHRLKGVEDEWHVFAATAVDGQRRPETLEAEEARARRDRIAPTETPRRRRGLVAAGVALALVAAALVIPAGWHRLQRGLPGIDAEALGAIDPSNGRITTQVPLGDGPNGIAMGAGAAWVALGATDEVARIDPAAGTVTQRIPVQANPTGVAFGDGAVWATNADAKTVSWIDPASDKVVRTIGVGNGPSAIAFGEGSLWVTNTLDGTVSKIDPSTGNVTATIPVGAAPAGIVVGAGSVWVASQASDQVARIDPGADAVRQTIDVGHGPSGVAFDGTSVWVANGQSGTVMKIDPSSNDVTGSVQTGGSPGDIAAGGGSIWVADTGANRLARIDPGTNTVTGTTAVENAPRALAFDGATLWVTTRGSAGSHQGGQLIVESSQIPQTIDPNAQYDAISYGILTNTNDGLLTYARVGGTLGSVLVPDLATSIPTPTNGGKTYTFTLRSGIRYSDGQTMRPSDVVSSFERAFTAAIPGFTANSYLSPLVGADACTRAACDLSDGIDTDDASGTVTFHLKRPDPSFLYIVAMPFLAIVPQSSPRGLVTEAPFLAATGPFMIDSSTMQPAGAALAEGTVTLVRNPNFTEWSHTAQPPGYPEEIIIRFGVDLDQATTDVEQGRADVLLDTPPTQRMPEIRTRYAAQNHPYLQLGLVYFFLNTRVPPFSSPDARRALNYAFDRPSFAHRGGSIGPLTTGPPTCQTLPPNTPGYAPYCPYTRNGSSDGGPDPVTAQRLVDASGTKHMRVTVWSFPSLAPAARYVVSVLVSLGYQATMEVIPGDPTKYFTYISDSSNRTQIGVAAWLVDFPDASNFFAPLLTCTSFIPNNPHNVNANYAEYCNPLLDRKIARAARVGTIDPARANQLWAAIDRQVVDDAPWLPFTTPSGTILVSRRVGNVQNNPVLGVLLGQMWVQ